MLVLSRCAAPVPEGTEIITWYAVNPGGTLRIVLYDLVCGRHYGNLRLSSRQETAIETCADADGVARVRYRPHGYASRVEGWTHNTIRPNQRVYVQ